MFVDQVVHSPIPIQSMFLLRQYISSSEMSMRFICPVSHQMRFPLKGSSKSFSCYECCPNDVLSLLFFYLFFFFFLFSISLSLSSYFLLSLSVLLFLRPFLFLLSAFLISLCPSLSFFSPRFSSLSLFFFFFLIQNVGSEINFQYNNMNVLLSRVRQPKKCTKTGKLFHFCFSLTSNKH